MELDKFSEWNHNGINLEPFRRIAMYSITVKNIPDEVYEKLKRSARRNRRSINNEIILILERSLQSKQMAPEAFLARARQIREITSTYLVDDEAFERSKDTGRE